ncbi:hypothetical protein AB1N83_013245 [Pleurotus pulmonarius]|nr:hypothetical protein EYR38_003294 [Pleurotus pulmonarius]
MRPRPYPSLATAFRITFIGHDFAEAESCNGPSLGLLGTLPTELLISIFELTDLAGAVMLGATHAHLFVIGYTSIIARIQSTKLLTNWAYDRIICLGDWTRTLPPGFPSDAEKHRLMHWGLAHKAILDKGMDAPLDALPTPSAPEAAPSAAAEREHEVAAYMDQSFHLYAYGCAMPSASDLRHSGSSAMILLFQHVRMVHTVLDRGRLDLLTYMLLRVNQRNLFVLDDNELRDAVLINTTKREFVRTRAKGEGGLGVRTIEMAIPVLTICTNDGDDGDGDGDEESCKLEGEWAGDRLAIVSEQELGRLVQNEDGWTEKMVKWEDTWMG